MNRTQFMDRAQFKSFVNLLVKLGYGKADPELALFDLIIKDDIEAVKEHLKQPGWSEGIYNKYVTDMEIYTRYQKLLNLPWVQKKYNELRAEQERGRVA